MMQFEPLNDADVDAYANAAAADIKLLTGQGVPARHYRTERELISQLRLRALWHELLVYGSIIDGDLAGVLTATANKRPIGQWGRYLNVYVVHTRLRFRGQGLAKAAYRAVAALAVEQGCSRLTTTAASVGGWATHRSLDWPAWGLNKAGQIVTDTDLLGTAPPGLPGRCNRLAHTTGHPMTAAEHAAALTAPEGPYGLHPHQVPAPYRQEAP